MNYAKHKAYDSVGFREQYSCPATQRIMLTGVEDSKPTHTLKVLMTIMHLMKVASEKECLPYWAHYRNLNEQSESLPTLLVNPQKIWVGLFKINLVSLVCCRYE